MGGFDCRLICSIGSHYPYCSQHLARFHYPEAGRRYRPAKKAVVAASAATAAVAVAVGAVEAQTGRRGTRMGMIKRQLLLGVAVSEVKLLLRVATPQASTRCPRHHYHPRIQPKMPNLSVKEVHKHLAHALRE